MADILSHMPGPVRILSPDDKNIFFRLAIRLHARMGRVEIYIKVPPPPMLKNNENNAKWKCKTIVKRKDFFSQKT
jgi:hypothetical protein